MSKKQTYHPYVAWPTPIKFPTAELYEIGYDTKLKAIIIKLKGDALFILDKVDTITLAKESEGSDEE